MNRQWAIVGVIIALVGVLIGVGWIFREHFAPVEVGSRAPDFVAYDLEGREVRLADVEGEVILLNIWATWCLPCREEMPAMQRLHERMGPEGLKIIAVSIDAAPGRFDLGGNPGGDVEAFAREYGLTFPIWRDSEGGIQRIYRTTGVPESFVIDKHGLIQKKVAGPLEWDSEASTDLFKRLLEG